MSKVILCFLFLCASSDAFGVDCGRASSSVEQAICKQPETAHLDAALNDVYDRLRPKLAKEARAVVVRQQRTWVAERNSVCASGDSGCLRKEYETRLEYLSALDAAASTTDNAWSNLHPLVVTGSWKATAIHDPGAKSTVSDTDLSDSLSSSELPAIGAVVTSAPGKLCVPGHGCGGIAWKRTALAKTDSAEAIGRVLGIAQSHSVLVGTKQAQQAPLLLLVPRADGVVWAIFALGGRHNRDHYAAEEWTPVGPSYTVGNLP